VAGVIKHRQTIIVSATSAEGFLEARDMRGVVRAKNDGRFF
jgi:hypothetical protein